MAYKIVGVNETSDFPPRVETKLAQKFADISVKELIETGRLSVDALNDEFVNEAQLAGGLDGQVLTRLADDAMGWRTPFAGDPNPSDRYTDWALSINPGDFRAPAGTRLNIPTYVTPSGGQATHPSVVYIPNGWNGYRYWMGYTPYPGGNDDYENPSIVASNDGITWVIPAGLTNPIDLVSGTEYNSDTDLIYAPDGKLYLFWRWNSGAGTQRFFMSSSNDGVAWSPKQLIHESQTANSQILSPSFIYEDSGLTMWGIEIADAGNRKIVKLRANVANLNAITPNSWSAPVVCSISNVAAGKQPWHMSLKNIDGLYVGILTDADTGVSGTNGDNYLITSSDGVAFNCGTVPLTPRSNPGEHTAMYRATLVPEVNGSTFGFRIWYGAWQATSPSVWNIYRTFATSITNPTSDNTTITPTVPAGRWSAIPTNKLTRKNGLAIFRLNATATGPLSAGQVLAEIPVGFRNLSNNVWFMAVRVSDSVALPLYYEVATHTIKNMNSWSGTFQIAATLIWDIEG